jgi:hypothetical protein
MRRTLVALAALGALYGALGALEAETPDPKSDARQNRSEGVWEDPDLLAW